MSQFYVNPSSVVSPVTLTGSNGIVVTGGPNYNVSNDRFYTKYVVSPVAGEGEFTTIQSAMDQAAIDGATNLNRKVVLVKYNSASYVENLSMYAGVDVIGESVDVMRVGNAVAINAAGAELKPRLTGTVTLSVAGSSSIENMYIAPSSGNAVTVSLSTSILFMGWCYVIENVTAASLLRVTAGTVYCNNTFFYCGTSQTNGINQSGGSIQFRNCSSSGISATLGSNALSSGVFIDFGSSFENGFLITGAGANFNSSQIGDAGTNSTGCINMTSGNCSLYNTRLNNSSTTGSAIQGSGGTLTFGNSAIQLPSTGAMFPPYGGLTGATVLLGSQACGNLTFNGGFGGNLKVVTTFPYNVTVNDYYISTGSSGARTINLPATAARYVGQQFVIKDSALNSSAGNITISGNGANIVSTTSAASFVLATNGATLNVIYNGTVWEAF